MEIFILWLFLSLVAAIIANNKGRSGAGFFLLSILLSPLIGIISALIARENKANIETNKIATGENKKCPFCAEIIKVEAIVCRYCGKELTNNNPQTEENKSISDQDIMSKYGITYADEKYHYNEYHYDALKDAVSYAEKQATH